MIAEDNLTSPSDFINAAERNADPTLDEGRVPKLEANGKLHPEFIGGEIVTLTANEDLTAGAPVGIGNLFGGGSRARRSTLSVPHGIPTANNNTTAYARACAISDTKIVHLQTNNVSSGTLFAQVIETDFDTLTPTLGTHIEIATATNISSDIDRATVCKLDTDKFIVFYIKDSSATIVYYRVGTVSGTTITLGAEDTFVTAGSALATSGIVLTCDQMSVNSGILLYKTTTGTNSRVVAFTVTGTTVNATGVSAALITRVGNANIGLIKTIAPNKFLVYAHDTSLGVFGIYAQIGTLSGTTITLGAEQFVGEIFNPSLRHEAVVSGASDSFVIRSGVSNANDVKVIAGTVSGTTITFGTPLIFANRGGGGMAIDGNDVYIGCGQNVSNGGKIIKATLAGTTLTAQLTLERFSAGGGHIINTGTHIVSILVSSINMTIWLEGMSTNWIGMAKNTVSKGELVTVQTSGIVTGLTGLFAGTTYKVDEDGSLAEQNIYSAVTSTEDIKNAYALSDSQLLL